MDLSKLTPAPWVVHDGGRSDHTVCREVSEGRCSPLFERWGFVEPMDTTDADFIALARNAFDVMLRRGWWAEPFDRECQGWIVRFPGATPEQIRGRVANDPFTALVEADKWTKEKEIL